MSSVKLVFDMVKPSYVYLDISLSRYFFDGPEDFEITRVDCNYTIFVIDYEVVFFNL
jgi:hypothetical protein